MSIESPRHPRGYPEKGKVFRLEQDDNGTTTLNGIPVIGTSVVRCNGSFSRVEHVIPGAHDIGRVFDGLTGTETAVPVTTVKAVKIFDAKE